MTWYDTNFLTNNNKRFGLQCTASRFSDPWSEKSKGDAPFLSNLANNLKLYFTISLNGPWRLSSAVRKTWKSASFSCSIAMSCAVRFTKTSRSPKRTWFVRQRITTTDCSCVWFTGWLFHQLRCKFGYVSGTAGPLNVLRWKDFSPALIPNLVGEVIHRYQDRGKQWYETCKSCLVEKKKTVIEFNSTNKTRRYQRASTVHQGITPLNVQCTSKWLAVTSASYWANLRLQVRS